MKSLKLIIILVLCATGVSAQTFSKTGTPTSLFENEKVKVEYHFETCEKPWDGTKNEMAYLTITNKTSTPVNLTFINEKYYGTQCFGCDGEEEYKHSLQLQPKEVLKGQCAREVNRALEIFSQKLDFPLKHGLAKMNFRLLSIK